METEYRLIWSGDWHLMDWTRKVAIAHSRAIFDHPICNIPNHIKRDKDYIAELEMENVSTGEWEETNGGLSMSPSPAYKSQPKITDKRIRIIKVTEI